MRLDNETRLSSENVLCSDICAKHTRAPLPKNVGISAMGGMQASGGHIKSQGVGGTDSTPLHSWGEQPRAKDGNVSAAMNACTAATIKSCGWIPPQLCFVRAYFRGTHLRVLYRSLIAERMCKICTKEVRKPPPCAPLVSNGGTSRTANCGERKIKPTMFELGTLSRNSFASAQVCRPCQQKPRACFCERSRGKYLKSK